MSLKNKFILYFSIPISIIIFSAIINNHQFNLTKKSSQWVTHTHFVISQGNQIKGHIVDLETGIRGYLLTHNKVFLKPFSVAQKKWHDSISKLQNTVSDNPPQVRLLEEIKIDLQKWLKVVATPTLQLIEMNNSKQAHSIVLNKTGKNIIDSVREKLKLFIETEKKLLTLRQKEEIKNLNLTNKYTTWLTIIAVSSIIFFAIFISKDILNGIEALIFGTKKISSGDFSHRIELNRSDEVLDLANNFNFMAQEVESSTHRITEANNAKSDFLAKMSHEIRTPLNGILGSIQLLQVSDLDEKQIDLLSTMEYSGNHLMNLLNDVLDLSKIEAKKITLEDEVFNLNDCIQRSIDLMQGFATSKRNKLIFRYKTHHEWFSGDSKRIKQIIINLISNAIKFTEDGTIEVYLETQSLKNNYSKIAVSIQDSGIGISKEQIKNLFTSFAQADNSISRKYGGTGLGLTISKQIAELMGGDIKVSSETNKGSNFTFNAILKEHSSIVQNTKKPQNSPTQYSNNKSLRILLVEDNQVNQKIATLMLQKENYPVAVVNNGQEALELLEKEGIDKFDLILMDLQMPIMDGKTATIKILERYSEATPPIIALTANAFKSDRDSCLEIGMSAFLEKPIQLPKLLGLLQSFESKK